MPSCFIQENCIQIKNIMSITAEKKKEIFKEFGGSETSTGTPESQVALFTQRITDLTNHLKSHKKDHSTRRALLKLVGKRRKLLNYLQQKDIERYRALIKKLKLRK